MKLISLFSILLFLTVGCESLFKSSHPGQRPETKNLTEDYARYRSEGMSEVQYDLHIDLTDARQFSGSSTIEFQLEKARKLTVDFMGGNVTGLEINGKKVAPVTYNSIFIDIPAEYLNQGSNKIKVSFNRKYSTTPSGFYRFVDPVDKKVYLYSNFEPYAANQMFPSFDQPDLKATYTTHVTTPKNWHVVTSNRESSIDKQKDQMVWHFPKSEKFSTYIYSLHAGEFKVWNSQVKTKYHTIPLRLFARQSLAEYVDTNEWFSTTKSGFKYFEDYFGFPYPFKKYDQLIVPEFFSGAMENVGAVTFHEWSISRTKKERDEKMGLANTILHEMAHMWFGNLVTMEWWNDIWLNESFASYTASKALAAATPYKEAWTEFYMGSKRGAYFQDQSVVTHPITFDVPNTDVVFSNFDAITYGKGASTLKQLEFFIGAEAFQKGLISYFHEHAFKNTRLVNSHQELKF